MATFAERLKLLRIEKELSIEQLAHNLGTAKSTISRYENGREPKGDILRLLTEYFDVSLDYLMGISDKRHHDNTIDNKKVSPEVETIAAHLEEKAENITPHKMKMLKRYIDDLFEDFDD